jgi:hypothetical protein
MSKAAPYRHLIWNGNVKTAKVNIPFRRVFYLWYLCKWDRLVEMFSFVCIWKWQFFSLSFTLGTRFPMWKEEQFFMWQCVLVKCSTCDFKFNLVCKLYQVLMWIGWIYRKWKLKSSSNDFRVMKTPFLLPMLKAQSVLTLPTFMQSLENTSTVWLTNSYNLSHNKYDNRGGLFSDCPNAIYTQKGWVDHIVLDFSVNTFTE